MATAVNGLVGGFGDVVGSAFDVIKGLRDSALGVVGMAPKRCGFLTDVEGNYEYFKSYVEISTVVDWTDKDENELKLRENAYFVFGGDTQDKGTGDIRVVKLILKLKEKYPDRVHLILGNRDANKLRLTTELSEESMKSNAVLTAKDFPYWIPSDKVVTPEAFLNTLEDKRDNKANRLRWILKETMGADGAFERRRLELAQIKGVPGNPITDDDVVQSYIDEVTPGAENNFMLRYLEKGELGYIFGRVLFVHGAVTKENMGSVPGQDTPVSNLKEWITALNKWKDSQVEAFKQEPFKGTNTKERAGHGLMDYGVPGGNGGKTVVYAGYLVAGNPCAVDKQVKEYLGSGNINTVVCGHVPHGDCPTVINSGRVRVITADTSYSKMGNESPAGWGVDNRGDCVSEVVVGEDGSVEVHGRLPDGREILYNLVPPAESGELSVDMLHLFSGKADKYVGREIVKDHKNMGVKSNSWVKARLAQPTPGEPEYLLCRGEGFKLHTKWVPASYLGDALFADNLSSAPECALEITVVELKDATEYLHRGHDESDEDSQQHIKQAVQQAVDNQVMDKDVLDRTGLDRADPFITVYLSETNAGPGRDGGQVFSTTYKEDAGGNAIFNETYSCTKPGGYNMLHIQLWDKNTESEKSLADEHLGSAKLNLNEIWEDGSKNGATVCCNVTLTKEQKQALCGSVEQYGRSTGTVCLRVRLTLLSPPTGVLRPTPFVRAPDPKPSAVPPSEGESCVL